MAKIVRDKYSCVCCMQCVAVCPGRLIVQGSQDEYPQPIDNADDLCISCGHCIAICPVAAISLGDNRGETAEPLAKDSIPRFEHIESLVRMRRSIRCYADSPMDKSIVERLLNVVRWAPTAKNGLPVRWLVINNREKVRELAEMVVQWIGTHKGMERILEAWERGEDPIFRGAPCLIVAYTGPEAIWPEVDSTIAVETLDLCATALRLGACWAGYFIRAAKNDKKIKTWLGLDDKENVQAALMLGHVGNENYQKIPPRPEVPIRWME